MPSVTNITGSLVNIKDKKESTIKLMWNAPKGFGKTKWLYGVYYGTNTNELLSGMLFKSIDSFKTLYCNFLLGSKYNTTSTLAILSNIESCTSLMIDVGIIGPNGIGPLSKRPFDIKTPFDPTVPPKDIKIEPMDSEVKAMIVISWKASCHPSPQSQQSYKVNKF